MATPTTKRLTLATIHPCRSPQSVPLAATFIASFLEKCPDTAGKFAITILDLYLDDPIEQQRAELLATKPDLAGFSIYTWNRLRSCQLAESLKQAKHQTKLFCGGPEVTADPKGILSEAGWDFAICGEGEAALATTLSRLLAGDSVAKVPGVATLQGGTFTREPQGGLLDPAMIPSPLLDGVIDLKKYPGMLWQIARGCSFGCEFCYDGAGSRAVRRLPLDRIEKELILLKESGVSQVFVLDSTFNSDRTRAVEILRLIKRIAPEIHFHFEVRSEYLDRQQAKLFAEITCSLQIGLQSTDADVLKNSGRNFNAAEFSAKVALLNESGALFGFDLIYGLPGDSYEIFRKSVNDALLLLPNHLDIFPLALLPGTMLSSRAPSLGLNALPAPPYRLISSPTFSDVDMKKADQLALACDIFYSRGRAVSWFMAVAEGANSTAAELLLRFAEWLERTKPGKPDAERLDEEEIFHLQCDFITSLYTERGRKKLLKVALDLITYNHHYSAALLTPPAEPFKPGRKILQLPLRLAQAPRIARFNHDIYELLDAEGVGIKMIASHLALQKSAAIIYPKDGVVKTEQVHEAYCRLLERLDGRISAADAAREIGIPPGDAESFLNFAAGEGIVLAG